jgi:hypothetical protein
MKKEPKKTTEEKDWRRSRRRRIRGEGSEMDLEMDFSFNEDI